MYPSNGWPYLEWVKSGRDWRSLTLYQRQKTPRVIQIQTYGITQESARAFCRRQGFSGIAAWARQHDYSPQAVSRAISEKTPGKRSQDFYDLLIAAMREEPARLHRQLAALRQSLNALQNQVKDFSQRIARFEQQLPPWM